MASSRIFVKGLPPSLTEADFKKYFSQGREVTDTKIFQNRRIGYVGYKTPEEAQKAVKYFNKTFIRMSKIGVELARPVPDAKIIKRTSIANNGQISEVGTNVQQDNLKRKRNENGNEEADPKLKEFLEVMKPKSKKKAWDSDENGAMDVAEETSDSKPGVEALQENQSDDEYESIPKKAKHKDSRAHTSEASVVQEGSGADPLIEGGVPIDPDKDPSPTDHSNIAGKLPVSDSDWARSRTSRLLGLTDEDEEEKDDHDQRTHQSLPESDGDQSVHKASPSLVQGNRSIVADAKSTAEDFSAPSIASQPKTDQEGVRSSMRLFIRNLPYDIRESDLQSQFSTFGNLEEVHVPRDKTTGTAKGFAYLQFSDPDSAEQALTEMDEQIFQGRLLHILPASSKRESKLDDFALSKLPLKKQQQIKRRREATSATFNWNALYMNTDAVISSVAERLGLSKSEVLDPTSSDAAVRQAHAETHVIQETKSYFMQHGVDLDAFKKSQRGDDAILVKNIPYDCSKDELRRLFEEHGELTRFLMPPAGTIAIAEFSNSAQTKSAFSALAYRKVKSSVLFLERAPKNVFDSVPGSTNEVEFNGAVTRTAAGDLKQTTVGDDGGSATLYVRNLNFSSTTEKLAETFEPLGGFSSARVKTKTDPKKPGKVLSMGFGFVEFRTAAEAQIALKAMDGFVLDGHKLQVRASHKGADAAEERRRADAEKKVAGKHTKIIIKNLPFQASKKDVRALFGAYGQLRSVRVPKKMDRTARGFAFADFVTPKEAENAMDALRDTHLLGRRLVLELASEDPADAETEIRKMQEKVGRQVNKVALQKLTSGGRKKFSTQNDDDREYDGPH